MLYRTRQGHKRPNKSIPYDNVPQKTTTFFFSLDHFLFHLEHFYCENFLFDMNRFCSCFHQAKNNNNKASFRTFERCSQSKTELVEIHEREHFFFSVIFNILNYSFQFLSLVLVTSHQYLSVLDNFAQFCSIIVNYGQFSTIMVKYFW